MHIKGDIIWSRCGWTLKTWQNVKDATHATAMPLHRMCRTGKSSETQGSLSRVRVGGRGRCVGGLETGSNWLRGAILWDDSTVLEVDRVVVAQHRMPQWFTLKLLILVCEISRHLKIHQITELRWLKEDLEFKPSLTYIVKTCLKQNKTQLF